MFKIDKHYKTLFETSEDFLCVTDFNGKFIYVNQASERILGYTREELLQMTYHDLFHPDDAKPSVKEVQKTIEDPKINENRKDHFENRLRHKNGNYVWFSWTGSTSLENKLNYGIGRDITFFKNQQIELLEAKEKALAGNKAKFEFMANITHELRTPLNLIQGMITLLSETKLDDLQKKYLEILENSSNTLLNLINDVLDLTKIESGKMSIEPINTNLYNFFKDISNSYKALCEQKNLIYLDNIDSKLNNTFLCDPVRIQQIVNNLLSNAVKFTNNGSVKIDTTIENNLLIIKVTDTGVGIPEQFKAHLFDRFSQANNTLSKNYAGTGLGLSIVKSLVSSMNGSIGVESKLTNGTTFTISLPVILAENKDKLLTSENIKTIKITKKILIVDDSIDNHFLLKEYLKNENLTLDFAENGLVAINKCKTNQYDLILMDIQMPNIDGFETTARIKSNFDTFKNVKIIALSAFTFINDKNKFITQCFTDAIPKPIRKNDLLEIIKKHLKNENDAEFDHDMVAAFKSRRITDFSKIEKYIEKEEFESIEKIGHQIAGVSASYGYPKLTSLAFKLENSSKNKNISEIKLLLNEMKNTLYES